MKKAAKAKTAGVVWRELKAVLRPNSYRPPAVIKAVPPTYAINNNNARMKLSFPPDRICPTNNQAQDPIRSITEDTAIRVESFGIVPMFIKNE